VVFENGHCGVVYEVFKIYGRRLICAVSFVFFFFARYPLWQMLGTCPFNLLKILKNRQKVLPPQPHWGVIIKKNNGLPLNVRLIRIRLWLRPKNIAVITAVIWSNLFTVASLNLFGPPLRGIKTVGFWKKCAFACTLWIRA
jgi:hypothetical protein